MVVFLLIVSTFGVDLVCLRGRSPAYFLSEASFSSLDLLGGSAGRANASYSGALTMKRSRWDVSEVAFEPIDNEDLVVEIEFIESVEPLRLWS